MVRAVSDYTTIRDTDSKMLNLFFSKIRTVKVYPYVYEEIMYTVLFVNDRNSL